MSDAFDRGELIGRVDGDLEFLAETVEMLDEERPAMMESIHDAIAAKDADALASAAHTYKGMVSNFCAMGATEAATRLEAMGRSGSLDAASECASLLDSESDRLRRSLDELLRELGG